MKQSQVITDYCHAIVDYNHNKTTKNKQQVEVIYNRLLSIFPDDEKRNHHLDILKCWTENNTQKMSLDQMIMSITNIVGPMC